MVQVDEQLAMVNADLKTTKEGSEDYNCLLFKKNELLNCKLDGGKARKMESKAIVAKKAEPKAVVIDEPKAEPVKTETVKAVAPTPERLAIIDTVYFKPDSNLYMSKADYAQLRKEMELLRKTNNPNQVVIRDTVIIERVVEKPVVKYVDKIVEKIVERPVDRVVEKIVEKPVIKYVDKIIDRPVDRIVEKIVDRPVDRVVEKIVDRPVDRIVEKVIDRPVTVEKTVTKIEQLLSLPPDVILFDIGKSIVKPQYNARLTYYATQLKKFRELQVTLNGFTDNSGNAASNQRLSEARAKAVKAYLIAKGVTENQIEFNFAGADNPIAENNTAASKSQNRRVEISFNK